jgi:hypothetical protein
LKKEKKSITLKTTELKNWLLKLKERKNRKSRKTMATITTWKMR